MSAQDASDPQAVLSITEVALDMFLQAREDDPQPERLVLRVEVTGSAGLEYTYDMHFQLREAVAATDVVLHEDALDVVIPRGSLPMLAGAVIDFAREGDQEGWVIDNPNRPKPTIGTPLPIVPGGTPPQAQRSPAVDAVPPEELRGQLVGDVSHRVAAVLERFVNPSIAAHGGRAELDHVQGDVAYLRLSGGCQGCSMATVTLGQGIEVAILDLVPEITRVEDVTDHAAGTDPFYEAAKK